MNKGALALLVHGGTENWSPERWKSRFDEAVQGPAGVAVARRGVRSGRGPLRRGLEAGSRRACGISESARDFQSGRWRRCADGRFQPAESAAGSRCGRRPHRSNDRICRASRADASSPGAVPESQPAREAVGTKISMAGERDFGRHHGPWHARGRTRPKCWGGSAFACRAGAEVPSRSTASNAFTAKRNSMRFCNEPISWFACCRSRRYAAHLESRIVCETQPE